MQKIEGNSRKSRIGSAETIKDQYQVINSSKRKRGRLKEIQKVEGGNIKETGRHQKDKPQAGTKG